MHPGGRAEQGPSDLLSVILAVPGRNALKIDEPLLNARAVCFSRHGVLDTVTARILAKVYAKVDAGIRQAVASCVGDAVVEDDIARARLLLPARMYGGGIRSLEDVAL